MHPSEIQSLKVIVTLTTLPDRLPYLQPVIDSIRSQKLIPEQIELYIPQKYRRKDLRVDSFTAFPAGCEVVRCDFDYGPATKILPAVKRHANSDVALVYCDDDRIYDDEWLSRLVSASEKNPGAVIAEEAMNSQARLDTIFWRQRPLLYKVLRLLSLGQWKCGDKHSSFFDIAEGYGGVLVKPEFFPDEVFYIPDILWTVDDIWLSGMFSKAGRKIIKTQRTQARGSVPSPNSEETQSVSLKNLVYRNHNRLASDYYGIKYMNEKFGVFNI